MFVRESKKIPTPFPAPFGGKGRLGLVKALGCKRRNATRQARFSFGWYNTFVSSNLGKGWFTTGMT